MSNALGCDLARLVGAAERAHDACIGNGRFPQRIHVLDRGGWQHCLGLPRGLTAGQNGALRQQPVREVEGMRGAETAVTGELAIEGDAARCFDFIAMGIDASFELVLAVGLRLAWLPAWEGLPARLELRFLDESRGGIGCGSGPWGNGARRRRLRFSGAVAIACGPCMVPLGSPRAAHRGMGESATLEKLCNARGGGAMGLSFSEVAERFAEAHRGRAAWFLSARNVPEAIAKLGLVGPTDRLVVCADDFAHAFHRGFHEGTVRFVDEPTPEAFTEASDPDEEPEPDPARTSYASAPEPAHHASYAHAAGACVDRLFWFVNAIGCRGLRVPDLRALVRAAQAAGAVLIVDDTVPSSFCCHPLALGAHLVFEALDRVAAGELSEKLVGLAVAPSVTGKGRRRRTDPLAEDAYLLLAMRLGQGTTPSALAPADLDAVARGLETLPARMQTHTDNARALAAYLDCHPAIPWVGYPGLASHPDHDVAAAVLEHGFGPAVEFELPYPVTAASLIAVCDPSFRVAPAGGAITRMSARDGAETRFIRLFAGVDDPLAVADSLDQALRMFCNPPQP